MFTTEVFIGMVLLKGRMHRMRKCVHGIETKSVLNSLIVLLPSNVTDLAAAIKTTPLVWFVREKNVFPT